MEEAVCDKKKQVFDWMIFEYEKTLEDLKRLKHEIDNPEITRLLIAQQDLEKKYKDINSDPKFQAYKFMRSHFLGGNGFVTCRGETSGQYAIYTGEKSDAGYRQYLFFDNREKPVRLPLSLITSAEEFENIPVAEFVRKVIDLF